MLNLYFDLYGIRSFCIHMDIIIITIILAPVYKNFRIYHGRSAKKLWQIKRNCGKVLLGRKPEMVCVYEITETADQLSLDI